MTRVTPTGDGHRAGLGRIDAYDRFLLGTRLHRGHVHWLRQVDVALARVGVDHPRVPRTRATTVYREIRPALARHADAPHVIVVADQREAPILAPAHDVRAGPVHVVIVFRVDERHRRAGCDVGDRLGGHIVRVEVAVVPEEHRLAIGRQ